MGNPLGLVPQVPVLSDFRRTNANQAIQSEDSEELAETGAGGPEGEAAAEAAAVADGIPRIGPGPGGSMRA